jgi:hypothetical protein
VDLTLTLTLTLTRAFPSTWRIREVMAAQPVMTAEELAEALRHASPSTSDDLTILPDGRRIDSRESAMAWLTVKGHEILPTGGQEICLLVARRSAR